jgi:lipooligosaccharide transport system permease protein
MTAPSPGRAGFSPRRACHLVERNGLWFRRMWVIVISGLFEPLFYLGAAQFGIARFVNDVTVDGRTVSYLQYVAPGLLAAAAMHGAVFDSTVNVLWKLRFARTYDTVLTTPLTPRDLAFGEISSATLRGFFYATTFLATMVVLGLVPSWWGLASLPIAALTAFSFAAIGMALTTFLRTFSAFDWLPTITTTLFLFSATFFPPVAYGSAGALVQVSPLYHAACLTRASVMGTFAWVDVVHAGVLVVLAVAGLALAGRRVSRVLLA